MDPLFDPTEEWRHEAACIGMDPDIFFPAEGHSDAQAKVICAGCSVREDCLSYALEHRMDAGVWGGMSGRERRVLRRAMRKAV